MLAYGPTRRITRNTKKIDHHKKRALLLNMPAEVILQISEILDVLDRAALALSCKDLAAKLNAHEHLDWDGSPTYPYACPEHLSSDLLFMFFGERLASGWIPSTLKYCKHCGKYGPCDNADYWFNRIKEEFGGKLGSANRFIEEDFLTGSDGCPYKPYLKDLQQDPWQLFLHGACPRCQALFGYWRTAGWGM